MPEKILIIDDDADTVKLIGLMLQKQGYVTVTALNGPQGLIQAKAENPDLILLDVMMPGMDGYEVARRLRADPITASTPILMFTAKSQLDEKVSGFEAGADDYMTKPTHPAELSAHVRALLKRSRQGRSASNPLPVEKHAFTIGVTALRGGLGISTVSVNLGDALRLATNSEILVAELRPGMGTLGPDMGEGITHALNDLLSCKLSDLTRQKVKEQLFVHPTGLKILPGSQRPKDALLLGALPAFEALVRLMRYLSNYLVLDFGPGLTPLAQKLLPACDLLVLIFEPFRNSVLHARSMLLDLVELGLPAQKILPVVVNRNRSDTQLSWAQLEEALGQAPVVSITPAPELFFLANRMKTTVLTARPDSLTAQQFSKLADFILKIEKQAPG